MVLSLIFAESNHLKPVEAFEHKFTANASPIFTLICLLIFFCCRSSSQPKPIEFMVEQPIKNSDMPKSRPVHRIIFTASFGVKGLTHDLTAHTEGGASHVKNRLYRWLCMTQFTHVLYYRSISLPAFSSTNLFPKALRNCSRLQSELS